MASCYNGRVIAHRPLRAIALPFLLSLAFVAVSCAHRAPPPPPPVPPRPVQLFSETPEKETPQLEAVRDDIEVDTRDFERTPRVVAQAETEPLQLQGARARLYGNAEGTAGWSVDNFVLFEVLDDAGTVIARGNAGFVQGLKVGAEHIDNLGRMAFSFEPGEIDITRLLPEGKPFRVRATALDIGGVGRVSELWLVLEPAARGDRDDLRED